MSDIQPTVDPVCSVLAALRARGDAIDREAADVIDRLMIEAESWRTAREDLAAANNRMAPALRRALELLRIGVDVGLDGSEKDEANALILAHGNGAPWSRRGRRPPEFGDRLRSIYASADNPQRDGFYVRTVTKNTGRYYELTDKRGAFWLYPVESCVPVRATDSATVQEG